MKLLVLATMAPALESEIAVRLADEGVPLRAIARVTRTPSEELRAQLRAAQSDGRLLELPQHDDWPSGFPRDQRSLRISRLMVEDRIALLLAVERVFHLTSTQARIFLVLLQNEALCRERIDTDPRCLSVHVHHLRQRLAPHGLKIQAVRSIGYQLPAEHRHRAMDLILRHATAPPAD